MNNIYNNKNLERWNAGTEQKKRSNVPNGAFGCKYLINSVLNPIWNVGTFFQKPLTQK